MEKLFALFMKLSSPRIPVPLDKQAHIATGAIGGFIVTYFLGFYAGVAIMAILAFAKEAYDAHNTGHTSDVWGAWRQNWGFPVQSLLFARALDTRQAVRFR